MALYACDENEMIYASLADPKKIYWCLECFSDVKVRRGKKNSFPHFYHLRASPKCRLYSKSEDHMCVQVDLEKSFPPGTLTLERPLLSINRVADVCWEKEKIVFEIQCSLLNPAEAASRIKDYKTAGYDIVWLLDDRLYNRKIIRPAEEFLRSHWCYFFHYSRNSPPVYYDQFEIFAEEKRVKKSKKMLIDLQKPRETLQPFKETFPKQIILRSSQQPKYFFGDRIYWALKSLKSLPVKLLIENWRGLEIHLAAEKKKRPNHLTLWLKKRILWPYINFLEKLSH